MIVIDEWSLRGCSARITSSLLLRRRHRQLRPRNPRPWRSLSCRKRPRCMNVNSIKEAMPMRCILLRVRKNGLTKFSPIRPSDVAAAAASDVSAVTVVVVCVGAVEQGRVVPGQEGPIICTKYNCHSQLSFQACPIPHRIWPWRRRLARMSSAGSRPSMPLPPPPLHAD